jgi:hypothetical protein
MRRRLVIKRVYIDNSVIGGIFDEEFARYTKRLFHEFEMGLFCPVISSVTVEEIQGAPQNVMDFFKKVEATAEIITLSEDAVELSNVYLKEGKFSPQLRVDTLHIAVATVNHVELITSWNFKHIVNLDRIRIYNSVNLKMGYPVVEIRSPREIIHE